MWQDVWSHHAVVAYTAVAVAVLVPAILLMFFTPRSRTLLAILILVSSAGVCVVAIKGSATLAPLAQGLTAAAIAAGMLITWVQVARPDEEPTVQRAVPGSPTGPPDPTETVTPSLTPSVTPSASPSVTPVAPATQRTLVDWVSDVNRTCAPLIPRMLAEKARWETSKQNEVGIASLKATQNLIKPIVRDITTVIELPSDRDDRARANDWIDSYRKFYASFDDANRKLQALADATTIERPFKTIQANSAAHAVGTAKTATKSMGDTLGIVCFAESSTG
jgi:hypothetical protein